MPFEKDNQLGQGRPKGSRNKSTIWFDTLGERGTEKAIKAVSQNAGEGDNHAAAILLARTWARRRGRAVEIDLPPVEKPGDLVKAHAALVAAVAGGELTPGEGAEVSKLLENQRRAIETADHEERLQSIERQLATPIPAGSSE